MNEAAALAGSRFQFLTASSLRLRPKAGLQIALAIAAVTQYR